MTWRPLLLDDLRREYGDANPVAILATVTPDGEPAGRCVVVRDLGDDGRMSFTTDLRSDKIDHLRNQPAAELVFWLAGEKRQWRVCGDVRILTGAAAGPLWRAMPPALRATFFGPPPGEPFVDQPPTTDLAVAPPTFAVLELLPDRAESLDLTTTPHTRTRWSRPDEWRERRINP